MNISFTDISRLAAGMDENQQIYVNGEGKVGVAETAELEGRTVNVVPEGCHVLTQEEFFAALAQSTDQAFADSLREGLQAQKPLEGREIRPLVDRSKVAVETASHLRQLEAGLTSRAAHAPTLDPLRAQLDALAQNPRLATLLQKPGVAAAYAQVRTALEAGDAAHAALAAVTGAQVTQPATRQEIARLIDAEGDLASALNALTNGLRAELNTGDLDNLDLYAALEELDERALQAEANAAKLDTLTATLDMLGNPEEVREAQDAIAHLLEAQPQLTTAETEAVQQGAARLAAAAKPLFTALARLDTGDPAATTPETLTALGAALTEAEAALNEFKALPGINAGATKEFERNLATIRARYRACTTEVRERLQLDGVLQVVLQVKDAVDMAADKATSRREFGSFANKFRIPLDLLMQFLAFNKGNAPVILEALKPNGQLAVQLERIGDIIAQCQAHGGSGTSPYGECVRIFELQDLPARIRHLLVDLSASHFGDPVSELDANILGDVLRGDVELDSYLELLESDLPDELLRTDLSLGANVRMRANSSGSFNDVQFLPLKSSRTNSTSTYVVKNVKKSQGLSARFSVASHFSRSSHARQTAKLNFASKKAAQLIGCGAQITSNGVARILNRFQLVQEVANGANFDEIATERDTALTLTRKNGTKQNVSVKSGLRGLPTAAQARIRRELQIQFAKLEWADWLSGQLDRTVKNLMIAIDVQETDDPGRPHISVEVRGIDNDASFPEGRPKLDTFNLIQSTHGTNTRVVGNPRDTMYLVSRIGLRSSRPPSFLPESVRKAIDALTVDEFRRQMAGLLDGRALDSAVSRFEEMKARLPQYVAEGRLIDDTSHAPEQTDDEVIREELALTAQGRRDFNARARICGRDAAQLCIGGFCAALFD